MPTNTNANTGRTQTKPPFEILTDVLGLARGWYIYTYNNMIIGPYESSARAAEAATIANVSPDPLYRPVSMLDPMQADATQDAIALIERAKLETAREPGISVGLEITARVCYRLKRQLSAYMTGGSR